jgi:hypothetical protein
MHIINTVHNSIIKKMNLMFQLHNKFFLFLFKINHLTIVTVCVFMFESLAHAGANGKALYPDYLIRWANSAVRPYPGQLVRCGGPPGRPYPDYLVRGVGPAVGFVASRLEHSVQQRRKAGEAWGKQIVLPDRRQIYVD